MRNFNPTFVFFLITLMFLPGCDLIEDIFEVGLWTAIIIIAAVVALIIWAFTSFTSNRNNHLT